MVRTEVAGAEYEVKATTLAMSPKLSYERWEALGATLATFAKGIQWYVGDWLIYGEIRFADRYTQAMDSTGMEYQTLANWTHVARCVPPIVRRPELSWSHHAEVASLEPLQQVEYLNQAVLEKLSVVDLRYRVRGGTVTGEMGQPASSLPAGAPAPYVDMVGRAKELYLALDRTERDIFLSWLETVE